VQEGKPVAPSFLLATVLWSDVREAWEQRLAQRQHAHPALQDAIDDVFNARIGDVSGRGKLAADMREIWVMQPRFEKRVGSTPFGLVEQPRFRAGFDFLRLRADIEEVDIRLADWWQEFSMASDSEREDLVQAAKLEQQAAQVSKPRVRRAPRPEGAPGPAPADAGFNASDSDNAEVGAPKKRRRRRRKPGEAGDAAGDSGTAA
jgi:poly(A) polymerase